MSDKRPTGLFGQGGGNRLPQNDSQLKHIFRSDEGHLSDIPRNRQLILDVANDADSYIGTNKRGNRWFARVDSQGRQVWAVTRGGIIQDGGRNDTPRVWDGESGLNNNPFKRKKK